MKTIEEAKQILQRHKPTIKSKYQVKKIGIFGSCLRGEQRKESDVDILVEFSRPVGFFTFLDLQDYLEEKLENKVDLVTKKALKPNIGKQILQEVLFV